MTSCGLTVLDIDLARGLATRDRASGIRICRGAGKGCTGWRPKCKDCYQVEHDDPRSSAEILQALERGNG